MRLKKGTVLITGARAPIALEMARSFHHHGYRVIMADSFHLTIARWSKAVDRYLVLPAPRTRLAEFKTRLQQIITDEQVLHVFPTCEEAFYISMIKEELPCKVWSSDMETMNRLHNKWTFSNEWKSLLNIPETQLVSDFTQWEASTDYVFKPVYSRFANNTIIRKQLTPEHFTEAQQNNWIAQKFIAGKEICAYSIWDNGILKSCVLYHPLYRAGKGSGIFFEPVEHPEIVAQIAHTGKTLGYTGQLCFDIILSPENIPHFIECNPRGTSGAHLLNTGLAPHFLSEETLQNPTKKEYAIKYALLLLRPHSLFRTRVRKSSDVIFRSNDVLPLFLQALSLLEITWRKFKHKCTWLEATTSDIEWNGYDD